MAVQPTGRVPRALTFPLEQGICLHPEAALLTGLRKTTVRRWLQMGRGEG